MKKKLHVGEHRPDVVKAKVLKYFLRFVDWLSSTADSNSF